ncbi:ComEA family DNA-binding protein [Enterobacteriaceae bacterium C23F]
MKTGIKTVLFAITLACSGFTAQAFAAPTPEKVQSTAKTAAAKPSDAEKGSASTKHEQSHGNKVSINTASAEELMRVMNGVGLKKAQAIVSYREEFGPFKSIDDLRQVPGMGGTLVERNLSFLML